MGKKNFDAQLIMAQLLPAIKACKYNQFLREFGSNFIAQLNFEQLIDFLKAFHATIKVLKEREIVEFNRSAEPLSNYYENVILLEIRNQLHNKPENYFLKMIGSLRDSDWTDLEIKIFIFDLARLKINLIGALVDFHGKTNNGSLFYFYAKIVAAMVFDGAIFIYLEHSALHSLAHLKMSFSNIGVWQMYNKQGLFATGKIEAKDSY